MNRSLLDQFPTLTRSVKTFLQGYAAILFGRHPYIGLVILLGSFLQPTVGFSGVASALAILLVGKMLRIPPIYNISLIFNGAMAGFFLAAYHPFSNALLPAILGSILLLALLVPLLGDYLWRLDHLPSVGLPFVLTTWLVTLFIGPGWGGLLFPWDYNPFPELVAIFLRYIGAIICLPYPLVGLVLFGVLFSFSRLLALLAVAGFLTGQLFSFVALQMGLEPIPQIMGFNHLYVSIVLGGFFMVPSISSFVMAQFGVLLAMFFGELLGKMLAPLGLTPLALPYGLSTLFIVSILRRRMENKSPILLLEYADLPEISHERVRLTEVRCPEADSYPLAIPFYGEWQIYQAFDGDHTHQGLWRHAMDFYIHDGKSSYMTNGLFLEDYYCFGKPVLSPVYGFVTSCEGDLPDMPPGDADTANNWGNHVVVRTADGTYVLLAHLRQGSLQVTEGMSVVPGTLLGSCGSSGRSPQPHLHLHVQKEPTLGSPTHPFHLAGALLRPRGMQRQEFLLQTRPRTGDSIAAANQIEHGIQGAFYFPVQRALYYQVKQPDTDKLTRRILSIRLGLYGEFRIEADSGANAAFFRSESLFSCYDRNDVPDPFLDIWLLSVGFTPLDPQAKEWRDSPSAKLIPCSRWQKILANTLGFNFFGIKSLYRRRGSWHMQTGVHRHPCHALLPVLTTRAWLSPTEGIYKIQARMADMRWDIRLILIGSDFIEPDINALPLDEIKKP